MKTFILLLLLIGLLFPLPYISAILLAEDLAFTAPKSLTPMQAYGLRTAFELNADALSQRVSYPYYLLDQNGNRIYPLPGSVTGKQPFVCRDWDSVPGVDVGDCVTSGDPDACCDGEDSGTCDDTFDNADCVADGDPLKCCTSAGQGVCGCWSDVVTGLIPIKNYLNNQIEKWENVTFE